MRKCREDSERSGRDDAPPDLRRAEQGTVVRQIDAAVDWKVERGTEDTLRDDRRGVGDTEEREALVDRRRVKEHLPSGSVAEN